VLTADVSLPVSTAETPRLDLRRTLGPAACLGLLVTSIAISAIGLGRFVVLPMMVRAHALVDANLARSLAQPIHFRLAEITLAATLVAFVVLPRWTRSRIAGGLSVSLVLGAAAWRAAMLPALYAAWSKVDLVAGRPVDRMQAASTLDGYEQAVSLALMFGLLATAWVALRTGEPIVRGLPIVPTPQRTSAAGTIHVESPDSVAT
jgi:hypothetical protein